MPWFREYGKTTLRDKLPGILAWSEVKSGVLFLQSTEVLEGLNTSDSEAINISQAVVQKHKHIKVIRRL